MLSINLHERYHLAVPTPKLTGGQGGTPRAKSTRVRNVTLLAQALKVAHQRVSLDVDLGTKRIDGFTELTVIPLSGNLRVIKLDAREMKIKEVYVNGSRVTNFIHKDLLYINDPQRFEDCVRTKSVNLWDIYSSDFSIHQHHLLRQKLNYIFGEINCDPFNPSDKIDNGNTEELAIILPESLKLELTDAIHTPNSVAGTGNTPQIRGRGTSAEMYTPIQIGIEYELINPKNGVNFVCDSDDKKRWHAYSVNSEYNVSTSSWVPCVDNLSERSTWSVEMNIPRTIKDIGNPQLTEEQVPDEDAMETDGVDEEPPAKETNDDDDDEDDSENYDLFVCTGDFNNTKETPHPADLSKKIVSWSIFNPVCAHHVGWVVGAFQSTELTDFSDGSVAVPEQDDGYEDFEEMEKDESNASVMLYHLPGQEDMARNTCIFAHKAVDFFLKEFGSFPFSSYGIAFVSGPSFPFNNFAGLSILSDKLLYPANVIEPMFTATEDILECIAGQWSSINIVAQVFNDMWCTIGIAKFMSFAFIRTLMGQNEFRFKIKQKMDQIVVQDVGKDPLAAQTIRFPLSESDLDFIRLKAPIVLFILDRRMTKTDKSFGLSRVLPKLFLQAMSGDLQNGTLSTLHFQYVCEKVNRNRLETFFKQWVFGVGTPIFNVTQKFNKKRSMIEVSIRQAQLLQKKKVHPKPESFISDSMAYLNDDPFHPIQPTFYGPMTIRVHEADGTPYEHIVDLKDGVVKFDVQYNTKFKRLKKNREENAEAAPAVTKLGDILHSSSDVKYWNLEEWPKRDEELIDPYEWIRVDTDYEWIAKVNVKQPDYMYGSQLQQDRDVEAQFEAVKYFGSQEKPNQVYCTALTRTVMDERYYYGVRIAAAQALAGFSKQSNNFIGLEYLFKAFRKLFCFDNSMIPVSNSFDDFGKFFLQKAFPRFLGQIKDDDGNTPISIKNLLLNLVKYNDNSSNDFQDCYYLSDLVEALIEAVIPSSIESHIIDFHLEKEMSAATRSKEQDFIDKVVQEIARIQKMDEWVPSYQQKVSYACIQLKITLARRNLYDLSFEDLLYLTFKKYHPDIRILAFRGLFVLGGLKNASIMKYFLQVCLLENSTSYFRTNLINVLVEAISEAAIHGTPSMLDDPEFESLEKLFDTNRGVSNQPSMIVIEDAQGTEMNSRRDAFARATIRGAIELLRRDYAIGKGLQNVLWELLHTSLISLLDRRSVFILSEVLYRENDVFPVVIPMPCVPLEELKKKIVAKSLGEGMLVIKREGRFRIQLSTKVLTVDTRARSERVKMERTKTTSERTSRTRSNLEPEEVVQESAPPLRLKLTSAAPPAPVPVVEPVVEVAEPVVEVAESVVEVAEPVAEVVEPTPLPEIEKFASRDPDNSMKIKITFKTHKLIESTELVSAAPLEPSVSVEQSQVTFRFKNPSILKKYKALETSHIAPTDLQSTDSTVGSETEKSRYVKIATRSGIVSLSSTPFEEDSERRKVGGKTVAKLEPATEVKTEEGESNDTPQKAEHVIKTEDEGVQPVAGALLTKLKSKTASRSPLEEPNCRASSPFATAPSPQKRKKTKIYIHSGDDKSKNSSSPSSTPGTNSVEPEKQNSIEQATEASKPKLKLKLILK